MERSPSDAPGALAEQEELRREHESGRPPRSTERRRYGREENRLAISATNHCLTGCVIGEVSGMAIATALGWGAVASIALAVGLAYLFGFSLTALPLVRAALPAGAVVSTALAADTVSITIMEVIDNTFVALVPGALHAGLAEPLLWGSIAAGFVIAYPFAFLANRRMIARGKGHALVHAHHGH